MASGPDRPWTAPEEDVGLGATIQPERDGKYYVYYGGADTAIGVATIDRDELIDFARHGEPWRG